MKTVIEFANERRLLRSNRNLQETVVSSKKNLRFAYLKHAKFNGADLSGADFRFAQLAYAEFTDCILDKADFRGATIWGCQFINCTMYGANLGNYSEYDLREVDFYRTDRSTVITAETSSTGYYSELDLEKELAVEEGI